MIFPTVALPPSPALRWWKLILNIKSFWYLSVWNWTWLCWGSSWGGSRAQEVPQADSSISAPPVFIGPESDHWLCLSLTHSLTHWLTHSCLVNLIDVTLACEDANSKLVDVLTVALVDAEDRVGNSLLQILKLSLSVIWCDQKTKRKQCNMTPTPVCNILQRWIYFGINALI